MNARMSNSASRFSTRSAAFATLALLTLAGSAAAQGTETTVSGFTHTSLGGATFDPAVGRRLPVRNIGSSGQDGVEIKFRTAHGGAIDVDTSGLAAAGGEIKIKHKGWDGLIYHRARIAPVGIPNAALLQCDFSTGGAVSVEYVALDANEQVLGTGTVSSPLIECVARVDCQDPSLPKRWRVAAVNMPGRGLCVVVTFEECSAIITGAGMGMGPHVRTLVLKPNVLAGSPPWSNLESCAVTASGMPTLDVGDAQVQSYVLRDRNITNSTCGRFVAIYGLGNAQIEEICAGGPGTICDPAERRWTTHNLGSSGQDGVAIEPFEDGDVPTQDQLTYSSNVPTTSMQRHKEFTGHVTLIKREIQPNPATGALDLSFDVSGMLSSEYEIKVYDDTNAPLDAAFVLNNVPWSVSPCPAGTAWVNKTPPKYSGCFPIIDPPGLVFGGPIVGASSFSVRPVNPGVVSEQTRSIEVVSTGEDIMISDISMGAPEGCNLADLTGLGGPPSVADQQLTVDDLIAFVNAFSAGDGCPSSIGAAGACNPSDVTGIGGPPAAADGQLTVDDLIAFVNAFSAGC